MQKDETAARRGAVDGGDRAERKAKTKTRLQETNVSKSGGEESGDWRRRKRRKRIRRSERTERTERTERRRESEGEGEHWRGRRMG